MRRRTFLKKSAIGIGALAGVSSGVLPDELAFAQRSVTAGGSDGGKPGEAEAHSRFTWGVNAATLKAAWNGVPGVNDLLLDHEHTLVLDQFYRVGGENLPATPTECRLGYNDSALFVLFRCAEPDMAFPYASLDPNWWREANWHSLPGLPSGPRASWPPYPDEVDFLIQPDPGKPSYYQFAATLQGLKFGSNRVLSSNASIPPDQEAYARTSSASVSNLHSFKAEVIRKAAEWLVQFQIPWQTLGGRPKSYFGFLPMRTRWRSGEFSSPVALAINECLPVDLLIETHFSCAAHVEGAHNALCRLPSGTLRWQRPALETYPDPETLQRIWRMESALRTPTDQKSLSERLFLAQRWMDLMRQEGFVPVPRASEVFTPDLVLALCRQKVNAALQARDHSSAFQLLDTYLGKLDKISRWWYADGSPGDIRKKQWTSITRLTSLEVKDNVLMMRGAAGAHEVDLHLALPTTGGVRIYSNNEGYWRPVDLVPLKCDPTSNPCSIKTATGNILVRQNPFSISLHDTGGKEVVQIQSNSLAFRFSAAGEVLATDFHHPLAAREAIYGFGERYDNFNENGKVFTLWGTDGWIDHSLGPANTTYKPLPVFHSSNGYMAFSNSSYRLRADIGKTDPGRYRLTQQGSVFDYYFWIDTPQRCLQSYTALTGRPPVPPKWAFAPWIGRGGGAWASGRLHNAVAEEKSVTTRYAELDIPHSAIYAEGPSALSPALHEFMNTRGIRVLGYFMPAIGPARQKSLLPDVNPSQLPILHCGTPDLTRALGYIDFTNPNANQLCQRALQPALDLGEVGSMVDFGDMTPDSARFYDGQRGAEMHNFYYYGYQRTISEVFRKKRGSDFILFARGAAPGTQGWVGQFAGDHPGNFNGIRHVLTGALNLCACGYSTWGSDIGGYFGFPQPAVIMRWYQLGCFSPLMRPHGTAPRDPWYFGEAAVTNNKFLAWTRMNLLNYIYSAAVTAHDTGLPIMRSMPTAFPGEPDISAVGDQYMFGPDLLVAPVTNEDVFRTITFPYGVWTSLWDGKTASGPSKIRVDAPLNTIPVYLRPGAVLAVQLDPQLQFGASMSSGRVEALIVTFPKENERALFVNRRGEKARAVAHRSTGGFSWRVDNVPEAEYLMVYGSTSASSITVAGAVLDKVAAANFREMPAGWMADRKNNRLVIRLPHAKGETSNPVIDVTLTL